MNICTLPRNRNTFRQEVSLRHRYLVNSYILIFNKLNAMKTNKENFKTQSFRNKKIATIFLTAVMILSVLMILTIGTQPSYAASGSVTYDPSVFTNGQSTLVVANGGSFTAGAIVYFYVSSTDTFGTSSAQVGSYTLPTGTTTLSNAVFHLSISETPGTYYIAASDDNRATFTSSMLVARQLPATCWPQQETSRRQLAFQMHYTKHLPHITLLHRKDHHPPSTAE